MENQNNITPEQAPVVEQAAAPEAAQAPVDNGKGLSIAALVLGILGIVGGWIPVVGYFTTVCAILGIVLGAKGRKKSIAAEGKASGLATAGLVLGIIGTAFAALGLVCTICAGAAIGIAAGM